jgi:hypothetical protein
MGRGEQPQRTGETLEKPTSILEMIETSEDGHRRDQRGEFGEDAHLPEAPPRYDKRVLSPEDRVPVHTGFQNALSENASGEPPHPRRIYLYEEAYALPPSSQWRCQDVDACPHHPATSQG